MYILSFNADSERRNNFRKFQSQRIKKKQIEVLLYVPPFLPFVPIKNKKQDGVMSVSEQGMVTRTPRVYSQPLTQDGALVFIPLDGLTLQNLLYL